MRYKVSLSLWFLLLLFSLPVVGQESVNIQGTIWEPRRSKPIQGASVLEPKSQRRVLSDINGRFSIDVKVGDTLLVGALGYKRIAYPIGLEQLSQPHQHIVLQVDTVLLGEVEINPTISKPERVVPKPETGLPPGLIKASIVGSPLTYFYNIFSKEAKERKKLQKLRMQEYLEYKNKEREYYNSFFKDNTGFD